MMVWRVECAAGRTTEADVELQLLQWTTATLLATTIRHSVVAKCSETEEFGRDAIQAVISQHLKNNVDEHSTKVNGTNKHEATPELLDNSRGLVVGPGACSVGHHVVETAVRLAVKAGLVQFS